MNPAGPGPTPAYAPLALAVVPVSEAEEADDDDDDAPAPPPPAAANCPRRPPGVDRPVTDVAKNSCARLYAAVVRCLTSSLLFDGVGPSKMKTRWMSSASNAARVRCARRAKAR